MKSTRAQAIKHYEPRYDTKKPCKQGTEGENCAQ